MSTPTEDVTYTTGLGLVLAQSTSTEDQYLYHDGQGSTRALADASGSIVDSYTYTAFGELYGYTGTPQTDFLYTGQQLDDLTGLYNLRARQYDPELGRFLSQDMAAILYNNPVELNRYVYTANNPINLTDPSGLMAGYGSLINEDAETSPSLGGYGGIVRDSYRIPIRTLNQLYRLTEPVWQATAKAVTPGFQRSLGLTLIGVGSGWFLFNLMNRGNPKAEQPTPEQELLELIDSQKSPGNAPEPEEPKPEEEIETKPPEQEDKDFDIALGIGETLLTFTPSVSAKTGRQALPYLEWPDWMIKDPETGDWLMLANPSVFYGGFKIAIENWRQNVPNGKIRFNLAGIEQYNTLTLLELRYIRNKEEYLTRTHFYWYTVNDKGNESLMEMEWEEAIQYIDTYYAPYFGTLPPM